MFVLLPILFAFNIVLVMIFIGFSSCKEPESSRGVTVSLENYNKSDSSHLIDLGKLYDDIERSYDDILAFGDALLIFEKPQPASINRGLVKDFSIVMKSLATRAEDGLMAIGLKGNKEGLVSASERGEEAVRSIAKQYGKLTNA